MSQPSAVPVLIDTDTGIDDAVALALAARLPALRVVAVTTVHGNTEVERATRNARLVAQHAGLGAPVVAGAARPLVRAPQPARETHGPEGLGHVSPAAPARPEQDSAAALIVRAAREGSGVTGQSEPHAGAAQAGGGSTLDAPGAIPLARAAIPLARAAIPLARTEVPLTLCCLGPLTNLARALEADPHIASLLGPVFVMGGALAVRGTQTERSEFNWWSDPEAAHRVLGAGLDIRLVPLDVTRRIAVPGAALVALRAAAAHDDEARFWADALGFYADFHRAHEGFDGCVVNDALAVALVAHPSLATWRAMRIAVSLGDGELRGAVVADAPGGACASVAVAVRAGDVLRLIARTLFARWVHPDLFATGAEAADAWLRENPVRAGRG